MGLGHSGPIGRDKVHAFCVATTFDLQPVPRLNLCATVCKVCDAPLPKGLGLAIGLRGLEGRQTGLRFFCKACARPIVDAIAEDGREPVPAWYATHMDSPDPVVIEFHVWCGKRGAEFCVFCRHMAATHRDIPVCSRKIEGPGV